MRYPVSGSNTTLLDGTPTLTGQLVLGKNLTTGRALWLRSIWVHSASSVSGEVQLSLIDASAAVAAATSNRLMHIVAATGRTTMVDFPAPGLKFATGCCIQKDVTTVSSPFAVGSVGGCGYEE